ncbi:MAG: glycosyltransferase family 9 protein [Bacteroidota bacterium]
MNKQRFRNILVVRTDRIGDVILSLPMIPALRSSFPEARISMLVRSYTRELAEGQEGVSEVLCYDNNGSPRSFFSLLSEFRNRRFEVAVVAYPRFRIALLLYLARIPTRIATGFRWYSFLFNKRVYEHRKTAAKHEAEYNLGLLAPLGCAIPKKILPVLRTTAKDRSVAANVLKELHLTGKSRIVVLHPGSGGSARDWKPENFSALAAELERRSFDVVVTGGKGEEALVRNVVERAGGKVRSLVGRLSLMELAAVVRSARVFVSNSTGTLHIAAAVGTPVVAFYPPVLVASPQRWGPLTDKKVVFVPDRNRCPLCKGGECQSNVCMDQITVAMVVEQVLTLAGSPRTARKRS